MIFCTFLSVTSYMHIAAKALKYCNVMQLLCLTLLHNIWIPKLINFYLLYIVSSIVEVYLFCHHTILQYLREMITHDTLCLVLILRMLWHWNCSCNVLSFILREKNTNLNKHAKSTDHDGMNYNSYHQTYACMIR